MGGPADRPGVSSTASQQRRGCRSTHHDRHDRVADDGSAQWDASAVNASVTGKATEAQQGGERPVWNPGCANRVLGHTGRASQERSLRLCLANSWRMERPSPIRPHSTWDGVSSPGTSPQCSSHMLDGRSAKRTLPCPAHAFAPPSPDEPSAPSHIFPFSVHWAPVSTDCPSACA